MYSQAGSASARATILNLEQLRLFFEQQTTLHSVGRDAIRVIGFESDAEYHPYRLDAAADAYYVGTESRDYIVLPTLRSERFGLAAHEYAHLVLHAAQLRLPPWLNEGLAEVFSTVHIAESGSTVGGDLPLRTLTLKRHKWMPLEELLMPATMSSLRNNRAQTDLFYAESWALTDMLVFSPDYAPSFQDLVTACNTGTLDAEALLLAYGRSLDTIARDLHAWVSAETRLGVKLPAVVNSATSVSTAEVPAWTSKSLMAELFLASGDLGRATKLYTEVSAEAANKQQGNVSGALAMIRLMEHDYPAAHTEWQHAIDQKISDASLCYRFALFAEDARFSPEEVRSALALAVTLKPEFDDALYKLALLERNAGQYQTAIQHLHAMKDVSPTRAFGYWLSIASADEELGDHDAAAVAAQKAKEHAATDNERGIASQMALVAKTNLVVQLTHDAKGHEQVTTTRIPRHQTDWNPFVEPGDVTRKLQGTLREVDCREATLQMLVDTPEGVLRLAIPDPTRVQILGGIAQFTCGKQSDTKVSIEFALPKRQEAGLLPVLRGLRLPEEAAAAAAIIR